MPCRIRNALKGESAGPMSRRPEHARRDREGEIAEGLAEHHAAIFGRGFDSMG